MGVNVENLWQSTWQNSLAKTRQSSVWQTSISGDPPTPKLNCEEVVRRDPCLLKAQTPLAKSWQSDTVAKSDRQS